MPEEQTTHHPSGSFRTLGILWIVYGIVRLIAALVLMLCNGIATLMFGALLTRVPNPFALMSDFHIIYAAIVALSVLAGVFSLIAGLALFANQRSARMLALIAAILSVSEIPFGTTLGIYTLVVLLPAQAVRP